MKGFRPDQANKKMPGYTPALWKTALALLLVIPFLLSAVEVEAAQLLFEPGSSTVSATLGTVVSVPVSVTLVEAETQSPFASFSLVQVGGNLNSAWINNQIAFSLNSVNLTGQATLQISVPVTAASGLYTATFSTMGLKSNETVAPASYVVNVQVGELASCNKVPEFSNITSTENTLHVRNNKQVAVTLAGTVVAAGGCGLDHLSYQLVDEYGELDQTGPVEVAADGAFSIAVPMVASCKGNDKDGRLYTVTFMAESEAGVAESDETRIVVLHDNRKP